MRHALLSSSLVILLSLPWPLSANPSFFADFIQPLLHASTTPTTLDNETLSEDTANGVELAKRQNSNCASGYNVCANIGAAGFCCRADTICTMDSAGHPACCPFRAACTGTIGNIGNAPPATTNPFATSTPFATGSTTPIFAVPTTTSTAGGGFVQSGTGNPFVRSFVPNSFYPFAFIPTTYTNAAACSSAYTSCQTDAASCTQALASGIAGVTITAPNGGATITPVPSVGVQSAQSICASLSAQACYGLQVAACQAFGTGAGGGNAHNKGSRLVCGGGVYGVGVGVGVAGMVAAGMMR